MHPLHASFFGSRTLGLSSGFCAAGLAVGGPAVRDKRACKVLRTSVSTSK